MAPEVLEGKRYGLEADIYSCGVIFYQMIYGRFPYLASTDNDLVKKIKNNPLKFDDSVKVSKDVKDLLKKMLVYDR